MFSRRHTQSPSFGCVSPRQRPDGEGVDDAAQIERAEDLLVVLGQPLREVDVEVRPPFFGEPAMTNTATSFRAQVADPATPTTASTPPYAPSAYWGDSIIWDSQC